jgi:hypothetical protein
VEVLGEEPGQVVVVVARGEETVCRGEAVATDDDEKRKERKKNKEKPLQKCFAYFRMRDRSSTRPSSLQHVVLLLTRFVLWCLIHLALVRAV